MRYLLIFRAYFFCLLFLIPLAAHAITPEDFPQCPDQTLKTDVPIPSQSTRLIFCYKMVNNVRTNHGPFWRFDFKGNLIEQLWYELGELSTQKNEEKPQSMTESRPDSKIETPAPDASDLSFMRSVAQEILVRFLPVSRVFSAQVAVGGFETRDCLLYNYGLSQFLRRERPDFSVKFVFSRGRCSLQGAHTLQLNRAHNVVFEVNDLRDYHEVRFLLLIESKVIDQADLQRTSVQLTLTNGQLLSPSGHLNFEADYQLDFDKYGKAFEGHQGKLKITEFKGVKREDVFSLKAPVVPIK